MILSTLPQNPSLCIICVLFCYLEKKERKGKGEISLFLRDLNIINLLFIFTKLDMDRKGKMEKETRKDAHIILVSLIYPSAYVSFTLVLPLFCLRALSLFICL